MLDNIVSQVIQKTSWIDYMIPSVLILTLSLVIVMVSLNFISERRVSL